MYTSSKLIEVKHRRRFSVHFVGAIFKRAYQIWNLFCTKLATGEIAENRHQTGSGVSEELNKIAKSSVVRVNVA